MVSMSTIMSTKAVGATETLDKNKTKKVSKEIHTAELSLELIESIQKSLCDTALKISLPKISRVLRVELITKLARALSGNKNLISLDLQNNKLVDEELAQLSDFLNQNETLTHLVLDNNKISGAGAFTLITALSQNKTLKVLSLRDNVIGEHDAVRILKVLEYNKALTEFNIEDNEIRIETLQEFERFLERNVMRKSEILTPEIKKLSEEVFSKSKDIKLKETPEESFSETFFSGIKKFAAELLPSPIEELNKSLDELLVNLKKAKSLNSDVIVDIKNLFNYINILPQNYTQYRLMMATSSQLSALLDELNLTFIDNKKNPDEQESYLAILICKDIDLLIRLLNFQSYATRIRFIEHILISPYAKEKLYSEVPQIEEHVKIRYRELALHFHPDKCNWLKEIDKEKAKELFILATQSRDELTKKNFRSIKEDEQCGIFTEEGHRYFRMACDYRHASRSNWDKIKGNWKLNIDLEKEQQGAIKREPLLIKSLKNLNAKKLKELSVRYGELAYHQYRAAAKISDRKKDFISQIDLRQRMALCLYTSNKNLEAQLCALAAIKLILKNSHKATGSQLLEAKKIFEKVRFSDSSEASSPKTEPEITKQKSEISNYALITTDKPGVLMVSNSYSHDDIRKMLNSTNQELALIIPELFVSAERSIVRYQTSQEEILKAKKRAGTYKTSGIVVGAAGVLVAGAAAIGAEAATIGVIAEGAAIGGLTAGPLGSVVGGIVGLTLLGLGCWGGKTLWKKGF